VTRSTSPVLFEDSAALSARDVLGVVIDVPVIREFGGPLFRTVPHVVVTSGIAIDALNTVTGPVLGAPRCRCGRHSCANRHSYIALSEVVSLPQRLLELATWVKVRADRWWQRLGVPPCPLVLRDLDALVAAPGAPSLLEHGAQG
jgi:hypothetical protein